MLVKEAPDRGDIIGVHRVIGVNIYIMRLHPCCLMVMQYLQWLPYELLQQLLYNTTGNTPLSVTT